MPVRLQETSCHAACQAAVRGGMLADVLIAERRWRGSPCGAGVTFAASVIAAVRRPRRLRPGQPIRRAAAAEGDGRQARQAADHALSRGDRQHRGGQLAPTWSPASRASSRQINYEDGAPVKKGDLLFTIEPEPYKVKLDQAKASEASAEATFKQAQATFDRSGRAAQAEGHDPGVVRSGAGDPRRRPVGARPGALQYQARRRSTTTIRRSRRRSTAS